MKNGLPSIRVIYRGAFDKNATTGSFKQVRQQPEVAVFSFDGKLDTRDDIIRVPFKLPANRNFSQIQTKIQEWLATMVEDILSVTFRCILEQRLNILEGKAFAAKNILLNIKQTCEAISKDSQHQIQEGLMEFIDNNLLEIISEVMIKYPQTSSKGASKRLKAFIKPISNKQNEQYDFLLNQKLAFRYNINGDYSSDIMNVINKIIDLPQQQATEDTFIEEFHVFCRELFFQASKKEEVKSQINIDEIPSADQLDNPLARYKKMSESQIRHSIQGRKDLQKKLGDFQNKYRVQMMKVEASQELAYQIITSSGEVHEDLMKFLETKKNLFSACQKVPSEVQTFSPKEIRSGQFRVYHSSILRVMTKWSEELYSQLDEASQRIKHRVHKFKTDNNFLRFCHVQQKEYLYESAVVEKIKVDKYLKDLKNENKALQALFSSQQVEGMYLKRFTNVGMFAGRLQEVLSQLTFKYLNRLIHSLLTISQNAGQRIYQHYKMEQENEDQAVKKQQLVGQINLVNLKIGDLLRARCICKQHEFINILALLYRIEEIDRNFIKIVKVKNRLEDSNNDILINLFFKNKVLCELQLAVYKEVSSKEWIYSQFNHFIYELKRSQFGVLSALSNAIAQHDPVVSYFTFNRHKPPTILKSFKHGQNKSKSRPNNESIILFRGQSVSSNQLISQNIVEKGIEKPFICSKCKNLKTVHNIKFYYRTLILEEVCNQCIEAYILSSPQLCQETIEELFRFYINDEKIEDFMKEIVVWNPEVALKRVKNQKELFSYFLQFGFIIEKGEKLPKVHFFRKTYSQVDNTVILSTIAGGEVVNFLSMNCKKQKNKYLFLRELSKFFFFELKNCNSRSDCFNRIVTKDHLLEETEETAMIELLILKEEEILKRQYLKLIEKSFEKEHPTLYLNNYKGILDYLQQYISDNDQTLQQKKQYFFRANALRIFNLQLQSSQISELHAVLTYFYNLKQINLSDNTIQSLDALAALSNLEKINISFNKISSIEPINALTKLSCVIASHNFIANLGHINQIESLQVLDVSFNILQSLQPLQGLKKLTELNASGNYIDSAHPLNSLVNLERLLIRDNELKSVQEIGELRKLVEINFAANKIKTMPFLYEQSKLEKLNLQDNEISFISKLGTHSLKELDLSNNQLVKIQNLDALDNLETLDLSKNKIEEIEGVSGLERLKFLNLSSNCIRVIRNIESNHSLEQLRLSNNPIQEIANIQQLKNLVKLDIDSCQLRLISDIRTLKKIQVLNLSNNMLIQIDRINELVRVQRLDLSRNNIDRIQNLNSLKYLQNLSLMSNRIRKIENLDLLSELKWVILSDNRITRLENLEELDSLAILQIENNQIGVIEGLDRLTELAELWLSFNQIKSIGQLNNLTQLKKLGLAHNQIYKIQNLSALVNLQFLDLQANQIQKIEGLDGLSELKSLVLSLNQIKTMEGVDNLKELETLIIEHNLIEVIAGLDKLKSLTTLILSHNKITKIQGLANLPELQKLSLGNNLISKIESIEFLPNLSQLYLNNNFIVRMQNFCSKLRVLNLSFNQIKEISGLQGLKNLRKLQMTENEIELYTESEVDNFVHEIDLIKNPIKINPGQFMPHSTLKFYFTSLMQDFDAYKKQKSMQLKSKSRPKRAFLIPRKQVVRLQKKEEKQKMSLIRTFTKTMITQL